MKMIKVLQFLKILTYISTINILICRPKRKILTSKIKIYARILKVCRKESFSGFAGNFC